MIFQVVSVLFAAPLVSGVIYRLNDTEYDRLPPLFLLEPYYPCLRARSDVYCYVDARLVSDRHSALLTLIQEFSAHTITHYDHTIVHRGMCVSDTCRHRLGNGSDLADVVEGCLNDTLYATHQLKTKLIKDKVYCTEFGETVEIDAVDYVVAAVVVTLLLLSLLGSFYDFCCPAGDGISSRLLLCFSVKRNWQRLVVPSGEGPEPRLRRLKSFNGLKAITTAFVILGHSPLCEMVNTNNPKYVESTYHDPIFTIFYSGTLIVQTFFIISGFLLAYNILLLEEKRPVNWVMLPKGVLLRWLRLTPVYSVILAVISTWLRHFRTGPLWKPTVGDEVEDCRRDWLYNILYVNNYIDHSQCMAHTWYLAADMQLSVLGLAVFCLLRRGRRAAVGVLFAVGLVTPAVHTYLKNLHAILLVSPDLIDHMIDLSHGLLRVARAYFVADPTFNNLYKRGDTNIVCYALGLALALVVYHLQKKDFDVQRYRKYRVVYWALFPMALALIMSGGVFYVDGVQVPLAVRMLYSSAVKLLFGLIVFMFIGGLIFKFENVYRGILEWRGWASVGRVSYCAYLVHVTVVRTSVANHTTPIHSSFYLIILNYLGLVVASFLLAVPCWMLVEAPCSHLVKVLMSPGRKEENHKSVTMATQVVVIGSKDTIDIKL